jgi:hypothetical protein
MFTIVWREPHHETGKPQQQACQLRLKPHFNNTLPSASVHFKRFLPRNFSYYSFQAFLLYLKRDARLGNFIVLELNSLRNYYLTNGKNYESPRYETISLSYYFSSLGPHILFITLVLSIFIISCYLPLHKRQSFTSVSDYRKRSNKRFSN